MAHVMGGYGCDYAMLLDMNALEHTYLAVDVPDDKGGFDVRHLITGMEVLDRQRGSVAYQRFVGFAINGSNSRAGQARAINDSRASAVSFEPRMSLITSSILATAMAKPTNTCARSRALRSKNLVRRVMTTRRWSIYSCRIAFNPTSLG